MSGVRMTDEFAAAGEADAARVVEWATSTPRKAAALTFTAGPERQAAYWIEWAEAKERERWESALGAVMPPDFKDWHENNPSERPAVAAWVISNLREREDEIAHLLTKPVAWMTLNDDDEPSMVFFDRAEALTYCNLDEGPTPLYAAMEAPK